MNKWNNNNYELAKENIINKKYIKNDDKIEDNLGNEYIYVRKPPNPNYNRETKFGIPTTLIQGSKTMRDVLLINQNNWNKMRCSKPPKEYEVQHRDFMTKNQIDYQWTDYDRNSNTFYKSSQDVDIRENIDKNAHQNRYTIDKGQRNIKTNNNQIAGKTIRRSQSS